MSPSDAPLVAIVDPTPAVAALLAECLQDEGFRVITFEVVTRPLAVMVWLAAAQPDVCLYNVGLPYAQRWADLRHVRARVPGCAFVVLTTAPASVTPLQDAADQLPIITKPFDLAAVVAAVRLAVAPAGDRR